MIYVLCDHKLGNSLIVMATYDYFKKRNMDVTYVLTQKNVNLLSSFPNIDIPFVVRDRFDETRYREHKNHKHKQILDISSLPPDAYVTHWWAQRMEYLGYAPLRTIFKANVVKPAINHTVVHVRAGDIDNFDIRFQNKNTIGQPKHHYPVPVQVYDALLTKEEPVTVVAQDVDNGYVRYLRDNFNVVDVVCSGDDPWDENNAMVSDYATLQACAETLILSCSTFAWCAGVSSNAKRIVLPSQGYWHHTNRRKIDLYPDDERCAWFDVSTLKFIT